MAQANVTIDTNDVVEGKTDARGRLNLGIDLADKEVEVAVLEVEDAEEREAQPAD